MLWRGTSKKTTLINESAVMPIMYYHYRFRPIRGGLQIEIEGQSFLNTSFTRTLLLFDKRLRGTVTIPGT
jgi:hypothetical protein